MRDLQAGSEFVQLEMVRLGLAGSVDLGLGLGDLGVQSRQLGYTSGLRSSGDCAQPGNS